MNSIKLAYRIGNIDDKLLIEAEKSTYIRRSSNSKWNDEVKISGEEARNILSDQKHSTLINGKIESYTAEIDNKTISVFFNDTNKKYSLIPDFSDIIKDKSDGKVNIENIIGVTNGKVYFSASFNVSPSEYYMELFSINLDNTALALISSEKSTHLVGAGAFIGNDGFVYYHYRGDISYIMRVDPKTDKTQIIATVKGYVRTWVTNGEYILCQIEGARPYLPTELKLIKIK